jgi:hypothetical protein
VKTTHPAVFLAVLLMFFLAFLWWLLSKVAPTEQRQFWRGAFVGHNVMVGVVWFAGWVSE